MRTCLLVMLLLATGCPPTPTCPLGRSRSVDTVAFGVEGTLKRMTMSFPAPTDCALPEGTFVASGTWTDEGAAPQPLTFEKLTHDLREGVASVQVLFTPKVAGLGELKVFIDPQLGIAQVPVFVARDGTKLPFIDERPGCAGAQRSTSGFVLCPDPTRDSGTLVKLDGGLVVRLDDSFAQVVGDVVWAERPEDGGVLLTRYVLDGGPMETHQGWTRFATLGQGFADERSTFRRGVLALVGDDAGLRFVQAQSRATADALVVEPDLIWGWVNDRWCSADGGCLPGTSGSKPAGLEREVWWESTTSGQLIVYRRPIADAGSVASVPLVAAQRLSLAGQSIQGTRRPTWDAPVEGQFVFDWHDGRVRVTHFPDWQRGQENDEFLSFVLDGGVVRFVRP